MGVKGLALGVYAVDSLGAIKAYGKDDIGAPIVSKAIRVFKKGQKVSRYASEILTFDEFSERYGDEDDRETTTYAVQKKDRILDALGTIGAISYANDPTNVRLSNLLHFITPTLYDRYYP